jgi:hypothetical protein
MRKKSINVVLVIMLVFLISLVADSIVTESNLFYQGAVAPAREFHENVTIPANDFSVLELQFQQGTELELIFSLEVKQQGMVIDVWFVNYANYVRLVDGNEFLFFIDGSAQEISKATKIVSVTQYDAYALVLANYNNVSVDVYLTYDINVYPQEDDTTPAGSDKGEEIPLWKEFYVMLPLGLIIGIIVGLLGSRLMGRPGKGAPKGAVKVSSKKAEKRKPKKKVAPTVAPAKKKKVHKSEKKLPIEEKKEAIAKPEKEEVVTEKPPSEQTAEKGSSAKFCGSCGSPVTTKFCQSCGEEVGNN